MRRVLIWLSGANPEILARCPTDQAKYVGVGSAVLTTSAMAAASCAFALHMGLHIPVAGCLLIGTAWGFAIMGLDRWLVSSVQRRDRWYQNLLIAFPRLALAVLIGLVISTPLVLRIFEPEIQAELVDIHRESADQFDRAMQNDERARQINDLSAQQTRLKATVESGGTALDVSKDPEVARLQPQVDAARSKYNDAEQAVVCEKEGRPGCGSGKAGAGIAFNEKVAIRDNAKADLDNLQRQLDDAVRTASANQSASRASTLANAQQDLGAVTAQLDNLEKSRAADIAAFNAENTDNTGMLIRIEALDRLTAKRPTLATAHLLLLLFITSIECLPILVKFLMSLGPPTLYERAVEIDERNRLLAEEELSRRRRATELLDAEDAYLEAQVGREAKDAAIERLTRATVQTQTEVAEAVLAAWRERELRRVQSDLNSYLVAGPQPSPDIRPGNGFGGVAPPFPNRNDFPTRPFPDRHVPPVPVPDQELVTAMQPPPAGEPPRHPWADTRPLHSEDLLPSDHDSENRGIEDLDFGDFGLEDEPTPVLRSGEWEQDPWSQPTRPRVTTELTTEQAEAPTTPAAGRPGRWSADQDRQDRQDANVPLDPDGDEPTWVPRKGGGFGPASGVGRASGRATDSPDAGDSR
ncbi:DUF4407 domain-containing protein [Frankia sp. Cppng1_Ct_nod]|uniref:DUF4407 domain-containing protein n=1 Tax=Frankia sp. Cppng1_Ct_nod TaxID=2897162 RepID=UPI0013EFA520|nr:DUF4407 domain-containing protein [Frankia sp. Cppng1_Ct_nod]